jgi:hypothetical protein
MRRQIIAHYDNGGEGLHEIAHTASATMPS